MGKTCPHCGKNVGREASKCWKCGQDLNVSVSNRERTHYTKRSGWGLGYAAILMVIAGALYYISSIMLLFYNGGYQICLGDIVVILTFIGAFLALARISYVGVSICCLLPGIVIALRLNIILIGSLVCILLAAHLIYKNKHEFVK